MTLRPFAFLLALLQRLLSGSGTAADDRSRPPPGEGPGHDVGAATVADEAQSAPQTSGEKAAMSDQVWVSRALSGLVPAAMMITDIFQKDEQRGLAVYERYKRGETVPYEELPSALYGAYTQRKQGRLPSIFIANGFYFVSAECAEVLERFDLGTGGLKPVGVFQHDKKTRIEGSFFVLNFGASKDCFVPAASSSVREIPRRDPPIWMLESEVDDEHIAVTRAALEGGADLWADPKLLHGFFVSERLAEALRNAKLEALFDLKACRIV